MQQSHIMQHTLLLRVEDSTSSINECQYFLLNYLAIYNMHPPSAIKLVLYTNKPAYFEAYIPFFNAYEMRGLADKSKMALLQEASRNEPGNILFCETDTYPSQPLETLFNEISKGNPYFLYSSNKQENGKINWRKAQTKAIEVDGQTLMFSEVDLKQCILVAGLNKQQLLALQQTETYFENIKQLMSPEAATALSFQQVYGHLRQVNKTFFKHYHHSDAFKNLLQVFFQRNEEESIPNLVKLIHHFDAEQIEIEYRRYSQQPFYKKWLDKVTGKGWSLEKYKKKI